MLSDILGHVLFTSMSVSSQVVDIESAHRTLGVNETGELCIRGPQVLTTATTDLSRKPMNLIICNCQVMIGYLNNPRATQACIDEDNWFHTGDIGYFDSDHHFYITDRVKELIKVKGYQVV